MSLETVLSAKEIQMKVNKGELRWWLTFYGHIWAHGRLNGPSKLVKVGTPFRYAHTEMQTQVVVICDPRHYQLDHIGTLSISGESWFFKPLHQINVVHYWNDNLPVRYLRNIKYKIVNEKCIE